MSQRHKVVLLTESRLINRNIEKALDAEQFDLRTLNSDAPDILEKLSSMAPDFIFLNTMLKGGDGFQLCDSIKENPSLQRTQVIFLSSSTEDARRKEKAIQYRANYFLPIPFSSEELSRVMTSILAETVKKTILYVEDSKYEHSIVVPLLTGEGYHVIEAFNGKEALDLMAHNRVDLIITDMMMPVMDGFELCRAVKKDMGKSDLPVLITSALSSENDITKGFEASADDYITKPIVLPELVSRVKRLLHNEDSTRSDRILVVDDSAYIRKMICQCLKSQGFVVEEAENGGQALSMLQEKPYQLIVTDYMMPVMDGYQFSMAVRQNERTADVPIVMASDRESKAELVKIKSAGIQAFVSKPFIPDRLIAEVERVLAEAKLNQQRAAMKHYLSNGAIEAIDRLTIDQETEAVAMDKFRTVLFMDIVSFTPLCEKLSAREVVDLLNTCFEKMVAILISYDAIIDKFIGDAIFASFGHQADGAHRAVSAAWEMIHSLPSLRKISGKDIHIRIGINSGHVIVGDIGSRLHRRDFTAIGDNVNTAQRLESSAPRDGILISETTYKLVKNVVEAEPAESIKLKGKQASVQAYIIKSVELCPKKPSLTAGYTA